MGFTPIQTGLALVPFTAGLIATSQLTPRLLPCLGERVIGSTGLAGLVLGIAWTALMAADADAHTSIVTVLLPSILLGPGAGATFAPATAVIMHQAPTEHIGAAASLTQGLQQLGGGMGLAVLAGVLSATGGLEGGLGAALPATAAFLLAGLLLFGLWARRIPAPDTPRMITPAPRPHPGELLMSDTDPRYEAAFWDQRYHQPNPLWSGQPNPALVEAASALVPGTALEAGCGEGADALWLAQAGWQVTGTDFSAQALARAADHTPAALAGRLTWQKADIRTWTPHDDGAPCYDLVTASFLHFPSPLRLAVFAALASRVARDGHLVIIGHHPSDLDTAMPRPPEPDIFYTADDLIDDLPAHAWKPVTRTARPRTATTPDGRQVTIHDTVLTAQRTH
ncbi:MFS transporter [Streptomyces sp. NPDC093808]|uniref:MFS transporter n=1 Tax=Streptomyces sp. NPDC093808 TaxID=3154985 RepID=UPI00344B6F02